jgi:hypothetical protein
MAVAARSGWPTAGTIADAGLVPAIADHLQRREPQEPLDSGGRPERR